MFYVIKKDRKQAWSKTVRKLIEEKMIIEPKSSWKEHCDLLHPYISMSGKKCDTTAQFSQNPIFVFTVNIKQRISLLLLIHKRHVIMTDIKEDLTHTITHSKYKWEINTEGAKTQNQHCYQRNLILKTIFRQMIIWQSCMS